MKRILFLVAAVMLLSPAGVMAAQKPARVKVLSVIAEQREAGKPTGWWMVEQDLSVIESACAAKLAGHGFDVLKPSSIRGLMAEAGLKQQVYLSGCPLKNFAQMAGARYILSGRASVSTYVWKKRPSKKQYVSASVNVIDTVTGKSVSRIDVWGIGQTRDPAGIEAAMRDAGEKIAARVIKRLARKGE